MTSKRNTSDSLQNQENIQDIALIDSEDIIPPGANSLFLSCARSLIYMSNKNATLADSLKLCCGITSNDLKSDIHLQTKLRIMLCEYLCANAIGIDKANRAVYLKEEYSKHFNGLTVYDFLVQVYQLSINNFSNNILYKKYAISCLSNMLHMKINYKKLMAPHGKMFEPSSAKSTPNGSTLIEVKKAECYLNGCVIYLQEFRFDGASHLACKRTVRFLIERKIWCKNFSENYKMCMNFAQFNDPNELKSFNEIKYGLKPTQIIKPLLAVSQLSPALKAFCAFINCVPVQVLTSSYFIQNKSGELNSIGKEMIRYESLGADKLKDYFNSLYGKIVFNDENFLFE